MSIGAQTATIDRANEEELYLGESIQANCSTRLSTFDSSTCFLRPLFSHELRIV
jgi:hypothetical protein